MNHALYQEIAALRAEVDQLKAEWGIMLSALSPPNDSLRQNFGLTPTESRILHILARGGIHNISSIIEFASSTEYASPRGISHHLVRLRKKIAPIEIKTRWGGEVSLEGQHLAAVRKIIRGES